MKGGKIKGGRTNGGRMGGKKDMRSRRRNYRKEEGYDQEE